MTNITIGHDSEFGLIQSGNVVSALDVLEMHTVEEGSVFPDNMNAEIAITPVSNVSEFHRKTETLLQIISDLGFGVDASPVITYPQSGLRHPKAYRSGCNPDMSAYTLQKNMSPNLRDFGSVRSAGGHIHIGDDNICPFNTAKAVDLFVTLPLMLLEGANDRRKMYGQAGSLRVKSYGVECRSLSNIWVTDPVRREFVWDNVMKAIEYSKGKDMSALDSWVDIPLAIDNHDVDLAQSVIDRFYFLGVERCL